MDWLQSLPSWAQSLIFWLTSGTGVGLTTLLITTLKTRAIKKQAALEAKDEQIDALIQTVIDLKGINFTLVEMLSLLMQTSKGLPAEVKEKAGAMVDLMRKDFGLKIHESVIQTVALAKEKFMAKKEEAIATITAIKEETTSKIDGLREIANAILSQEINKD